MDDDISVSYLKVREDANMAGSTEWRMLLEGGVDPAGALTEGEMTLPPEDMGMIQSASLGPTSMEGMARPELPQDELLEPAIGVPSQAPQDAPQQAPEAVTEDVSPGPNAQSKFPSMEQVARTPLPSPPPVPGQMELPLNPEQPAPAEPTPAEPANDNMALDLVKQIIGGVGTGANEFIQTVGSLSNYLQDNTIDFRPMINAALDAFNTPENIKNFQLQFPEVEKPDTFAGGMVRGLTQFLTGFIGGGKFLKALDGYQKWKKGRGTIKELGDAALKGMIADFAFFDPHEDNLSNWIQTTAAKNVVNDFLAHKIGESELEGRLKNTAEGGFLGLGIDSVVLMLKFARGARKAHKELTDEASKRADGGDDAAQNQDAVTPAETSSSSVAASAKSRSPNVLPFGNQASASGSQVSTSSPPFGMGDTFANPPPSNLRGTRYNTSNSSASIGLSPKEDGVYQPINNKTALLQEAERQAPNLKNIMDRLATEIGGVEVVTPRVKSDAKGRLSEKIELRGGADRINDYLAAQFVVDSHDSLMKLVKRLDTRMTVDPQYYDDFLEKLETVNTKGGYRAIHMQVVTPGGFSAEIQIHPRPVHEVYQRYHWVYDKYRSVTHIMDMGEAAERITLLNEAFDAYDAAWRQWTRDNFLQRNTEVVRGGATVAVGAAGGLVVAGTKVGSSGARATRSTAVREAPGAEEEASAERQRVAREINE